MIFSDLCKIHIPSDDNYLCAIQCTCFHDLLYISVTQRIRRIFSPSIVGSMIDGVDEMSSLMTEPTKWHVLPPKTQIIPVWSESLLLAWRKLESLATHWVHSEDWSESSLGTQLFCFCHDHRHHIHFRALFSSTEGWAFWQVFLEGVLSTQNDFEGQQNPYLASFCHSQALHPMISLACQIFSVQPHSACVLLQSSLCCALHVQTISSYWFGAPHLSPGCQALWEGRRLISQWKKWAGE